MKNSFFKRCVFVTNLACLVSISTNLWAEETNATEETTEPSTFQLLADHLGSIWEEGNYKLLVPVHTYHSPLSYSSSKRKEYNENPWGIGIGKYFSPTPDKRYGLAAMTFQDSFNKPEPSFFYSWQTLWRTDKDFRPSVGFIAGITFRENYNWIPVPGAAPTIGFDYKSISVDTLYVPGFDVFLTWLTWHF